MPYGFSVGGSRLLRRYGGAFRVLNVSERSMTGKVTLNLGHGMNYHSHERRNEVWTVIAGSGRVVIDGVYREVKAGDVIDLPVGCKHTVSASSDGLQIIEVQMGGGDKCEGYVQLELSIFEF